MIRVHHYLFFCALVLGLSQAGVVPAKPRLGVEVRWVLPDAEPGARVQAELVVLAHLPVHSIDLRVQDVEGLVEDERPAYHGPLTEALRFPVTVRIPRPDQPTVVAVVEVESAAGRYRVQAVLSTPSRVATPSSEAGISAKGQPLIQYAARASSPSTTSGSAAPALVLTGRFFYRDRVFNADGFIHASMGTNPVRPIRFADVELLDRGSVIDSGHTDDSGNVSFAVTPTGPEVYQVRVNSSTQNWGGTDIRVFFASNNLTLYSVISNSIANPSGDSNFGSMVAEPTAGGEAFNILDSGLEGANQVEILSGSLPSLSIFYYWNPSLNQTAFDRVSRSISLSGDDGYDDCVILHEYGHFVTWVYSKDENPGGIHYVDDMTQDVRLSWSEGFASYFQSSVRYRLGHSYPGWYVDTWGTPGAGQLVFSYDAEGPSFNLIGLGSETVIHALLWDIEDGAGTSGDPEPGTDDDPLELTALETWEVIAGPMKSSVEISMEDYWDGWFDVSVNNGHDLEMNQTFTALGVELVPDGFEDDDDTGSSTPLLPDGSVQHHTFYPAGDEDFHRVDLTAGEMVTLETLNILGYGATLVEVLDPAMTSVALIDGGNDLQVLLEYTPATTGVHQIRVVRSFQSNRARYTDYGSYDLRVVEGDRSGVSLSPFPVQAGVNNQGFGAGTAFADPDADGDLDLYLVNNSGAGAAAGRDVLFRNEGGDTFADITSQAGLGSPEGNIGVAWGDLDNDGDPDLFVTDHGLFRNLGGTFQDMTGSSGVTDIGREFDAAWVDANLDGHLDLFVVNRSGRSALWQNDQDGTFTNVTSSSGFNFPIEGDEAYSCAWADYDQDGHPDLFMTHRASPGHSLYRNLGTGQFENVTASAGVESDVSAISGVWGDVNGDGWLDLFVANSGWNLLYLNQGDGTFLEKGGDYGLQQFRSSQGAGLADYDLDGDLDLYVVNLNDQNVLYENLGETMLKTSNAPENGVGLGCAWGDVDNDGDPDLYLTRGCATSCQANQLYRNQAQESGSRNWLSIALRGQVSNRDGIGARMSLHAAGVIQTREVGTGVGWGAKSRTPELFGLPRGTVDSVEVFWPSGVRTVTQPPLIDGRITIVEDGTVPVLPEPPVTGRMTVAGPFPNPFRSATTVVFTLPEETTVAVDVFDLTGRRLRRLVDREFGEGTHHVGWDGLDDMGRKTRPGVYFYRLTAGGITEVRKLVRLGN